MEDRVLTFNDIKFNDRNLLISTLRRLGVDFVERGGGIELTDGSIRFVQGEKGLSATARESATGQLYAINKAYSLGVVAKITREMNGERTPVVRARGKMKVTVRV